MIAIVDYGLGNIRAFENIYRSLGMSASPVKTVNQLSQASKIILPGVGAFDWAMENLKLSGMAETLNDLVTKEKIPVLGVCVGMQIMANSSDEGKLPGLGWIDAEVKRFDVTNFKEKIPVPHMGWNNVSVKKQCKLFAGIDKPQYYFLHSYYVKMHNETDIIGLSSYGIQFASAIRSSNIFATQFHPEKSHQWGISLLKNFAELC